MAQVINDLVIKLSADSQSFTEDVERAKRKLSEFGALAKETESGVSGAGSLTGGGTSGIFGGIFGSSGANGMLGEIGAVEGGIGGLVSSFAGLAASVAGPAAMLNELYQGLNHGMEVAEQTELGMAKFEAILRATGNASGFTAEQLDDMARGLNDATLASTEGARDAEARLLTFTSITGEAFKQTLAAAQDITQVFGGELAGNATMLAKALQDPINGLSSLTRNGITFTQSQKDMIAAMAKAGDVAGAQGAILKAVADQLGGTGAKAATGTVAGAADAAGKAFDEFWEAAADRLHLLEAAKASFSATTAMLVTLRNELVKPLPYAGVPKDQLDTQAKAVGDKLAELQEKRKALGDPGIWNGKHLIAQNLDVEIENTKKQLDEVNAAQKKIADETQAQSDSKTAQAATSRAWKEAGAGGSKTTTSTAASAASTRAASVAEAAQRELEAQQKAGASLAAQMDLQYADEQGKLDINHRERLDKIQSMVDSEADIHARGYANLEAMRNAYTQQENDDYIAKTTARQQAEEQSAADEQDRQAQIAQDALDQKERQRQAQNQAVLNMASYTSETLGQLESAMGGSGKKQSTAMKAMLAAQKLLAIPSIIIAGQQAAANAEAFSSATGGLISAAAAAAIIEGQTAMRVGLVVGQTIQGMAHSGIDAVPNEGTWLLDKGERVYTQESAKQIDQMYDTVRNGSGANATINQVFNFDGAGGEGIEQRIAAAARDGAQQGYAMVLHDFATRGQIRRLANV